MSVTVLSKHFKRKELECKCGCGLFNMSPQFVFFLEEIRQTFGAPMHISSGCRCEEHNLSVGGVSNSAHLNGLAVDVMVFNAAMTRGLVEAAINHQASGIGVYTTWVHIDRKPRLKPAMWSNR